MKWRTAEKIFKRQAKEAGFKVRRSPAIRIRKPVENKRGKRVKRVTEPDFLIQDPYTGDKYYIEVTKGSGNGPHKAAQQRVIDAAGIDNYHVITGDKIEMLRQALTPEQKYLLLTGFLQ